jgi:siderophore synthetase component
MDEESMTDVLLREYPHVENAFREQLEAKNYELIPVHPWQLRHTIVHHFKEEISKRIIVPLKDASIPTASLLSFRSLAPINSSFRHHLKTAVDVQMTSAKRIVSPASVWNGPLLSTILKKIEALDLSIGTTLQFMEERAGGHYQPQHNENAMFLKKNLSALLRENPERLLDKDEIALPAAFLINKSPFSGELFLLELIEKYRVLTNTNIESAAIQYIHAYAKILLPGLLTLIVKYGISLEAHLQNAVPVFRNGIPIRILLRDNGGVRIKEERLKKSIGYQPIDNSTNLLTNDERDLFTMFSHALLHNHLGEMIFILSKETGIDEKTLWNPVREVIFSTINLLKEDQDCVDSVQELEKNLRSHLAPLKALFKMRLTDQFTDNAYTLIPNPLKEEKEGDHEYGN